MDKLPNDIIMRIIREADGGRSQHKIYLNKVFGEFREDMVWDMDGYCLCDAIDYGLEKNVILREIYNEDSYDVGEDNGLDPCEYPTFGYNPH